MCTNRTARPSSEQLRAAALIHAGRAALAELVADLVDAEQALTDAGGDIAGVLEAAERIDALDLRDAIAPVLEGAEALQNTMELARLHAA